MFISYFKYKEIILELSKDNDKAYECYKVFKLAFKFISKQKNIVIEELKPLLLRLIKEGNENLKYWLIKIINEYKKICSAQECEFIPPLCKELSLSAENHMKCRNLALMGIYFAEKNSVKFKSLIRVC